VFGRDYVQIEELVSTKALVREAERQTVHRLCTTTLLCEEPSVTWQGVVGDSRDG
jgi:hypothetical protein